MWQQEASNPTEHFRPKMAVQPEAGFVSASTGYWWLAWDWNNLLFSCTTCNGQDRKGHRFALAPGSAPLEPEEPPPGDENSMFIDPGQEDPMDHIIFVERRPGEWVPVPRNGSPRGKYTIKTLGLDHPDLLTFYDDHVSYTAQPSLDEVRSALRAEEPTSVTSAWSSALRKLFHRRQRFLALSFDVVNASIPATTRARWHLSLQRP